MPKEVLEQTALTCASLESEANLKPGSIVGITVFGTGAVEIESNVQLSSSQRNAVRAALSKRSLPNGGKPVIG